MVSMPAIRPIFGQTSSGPGNRASFTSSWLTKQSSDVVQIRFGKAATLNPEDENTIQSALDQSTYAKDLEHLLSDASGFKVSSWNGHIVLENYNSNASDEAPFRGVCNDLTYLVGKHLQKQLGNDYVIQACIGTCDHYFEEGTHIFLLMCPKSKDVQILAQLAVSKAKLPDGCTLIDPSFNRKLTNEDLESKEYHLGMILDLEELDPKAANRYISLPKAPKDSVQSIPIGLLKNIIPEAVKRYGKNAMLNLDFAHMDRRSPLALLSIQAGPRAQKLERANELLTEIPKNHSLSRFFRKVTHDLQRPKNEQFKDYADYLLVKQ